MIRVEKCIVNQSGETAKVGDMVQLVTSGVWVLPGQGYRLTFIDSDEIVLDDYIHQPLNGIQNFVIKSISPA